MTLIDRSFLLNFTGTLDKCTNNNRTFQIRYKFKYDCNNTALNLTQDTNVINYTLGDAMKYQLI